jgi:hypothetical protein
MNLLQSQNAAPDRTASARGPRRRHVALVTGAVLVGTTLTLTGCAPHGAIAASGAHAERAVHLDLPAENVDQWVLPLDDFVLGNTKNADYARNLLVEPCMERAGYSWKVPRRDTSATDGASWNRVERRLVNPTLAAEWGFHLAPSPDTTLDALQAFIARADAVGPTESAQVAECVLASHAELPPLTASAQLGASDASQAYSGALTDPAVRAAAEQWRSCMAPAAVSDLPASPEEFPSQSVVSEFDIQLDVSHTPPSVSRAEIALATFEARCEVSSGYQAALYGAEWDRQVTLLQRDAVALGRVKEQLDAYDARVRAVISTHAPEH